jgi:uncharacterized radical SAM protein YgiQ
MISKTGTAFDIILITGEYYDDHPLSPAGVIARVLDAKGFSVGIIEKPANREDFTKLGAPLLCFCVTSGSIDSMLNNYTPMKKKRTADLHSHMTPMPNRAVIYYCNKIREFHKQSRIVIGGIEASLRRFAHYDYWDNALRRSILFDSRADILVYGNGEKQIVEIAERLRNGADLKGIEGTCIISKTIDSSFEVLPSFEEVTQDKKTFCKMQLAFSNHKNLAQKCGPNYLLQYRYPVYTPEDLDWIYSLNYSRKLHRHSLLKMAHFSVVTHRGCIGRCSFCSVALHQGDKIISRTEKSILNEIDSLTRHPEFKGFIDDLGGPSANMYGMDCNTACENVCLKCPRLDKSCKRLIDLLRKSRKISGIKKVFIRSGIRYDLALSSREYLQDISRHHISGCLKIAPEHFSAKVLPLMNKDNSTFDEFLSLFNSLNKNKNQQLRYYFMLGHPGDDKAEVMLLKRRISTLKNIEQFQLFTPTPMTMSSCMYWTELNPFTLEEINVVKQYKAKKELKRILLPLIRKSPGRDRSYPDIKHRKKTRI